MITQQYDERARQDVQKNPWSRDRPDCAPESTLLLSVERFGAYARSVLVCVARATYSPRRLSALDELEAGGGGGCGDRCAPDTRYARAPTSVFHKPSSPVRRNTSPPPRNHRLRMPLHPSPPLRRRIKSRSTRFLLEERAVVSTLPSLPSIRYYCYVLYIYMYIMYNHHGKTIIMILLNINIMEIVLNFKLTILHS